MEKKKEGASRRDFLKFAGASAPAVVVAATSVPDTAEATEMNVEGSGLRKTEHVKKYLASARF